MSTNCPWTPRSSRSALISTRLQPGVMAGPHTLSRFSGFRGQTGKPLKRFSSRANAITRLKPGANEKGVCATRVLGIVRASTVHDDKRTLA